MITKPLQAVTVCVDYSDYLSITLPRNRPHFSQFTVITTPTDLETIRVARENQCKVFTTTSFYDDGALFNKWKALERGLDQIGRRGWICLMDADVIWPEVVDLDPKVGNLYVPLRRMYRGPLSIDTEIPGDAYWSEYPYHRNSSEFVGYSQIFHSLDLNLPDPPWHQVNWKHAGGADSFFQLNWDRDHKIRPDWEVLHLGPAATNWCGRVSGYLDGSTPDLETARHREATLKAFWRSRRGAGVGDRFAPERLDIP